MRMITIHGSKVLHGAEGLAVRLQASAVMRARTPEPFNDRSSGVVIMPNIGEVPQRRSVERAIHAIEERLVKAFWVLGRSTSNPCPITPARHGLGYLFERADQEARYQDAAGQNWESVSPRAPLPSGREIDASDVALDWLQLLDRERAEIVSAGARSKRGDVDRRVNWIRVRLQLPQFSEWSASRLRRAYQSGLSHIAAEVML